MAAIDKLYIKSYHDYDQLLRWSLIYYPKLLNWFYTLHLTFSDVEECRKEYAKKWYDYAQNRLKTIGKYDSMEEICQEIIDEAKKTYEEWADEHTIPVMNTPTWVDKKLKWICPLPFIREYLHKQCGVNPKYEWFYKLFWKGKKLFL